MKCKPGSPKFRPLRRLRRALVLSISALALASCGEGYFAVGSDGFYYEGGYDYRYDYRDSNCRSVVYPAVVIEFFAVEDRRRLAVYADGDLESSDGIERLQVDREASDDRVYSLAGGFDRAGRFDVSVTARRSGDQATQTFLYDDIRVESDRCGPITVFLSAVLN